MTVFLDHLQALGETKSFLNVSFSEKTEWEQQWKGGEGGGDVYTFLNISLKIFILWDRDLILKYFNLSLCENLSVLSFQIVQVIIRCLLLKRKG